MFLWLHLLILILATDATTTTEKPMYTIVAPNTMFSRATYTVQVFIHGAKQAVNVKVELQKASGNNTGIFTFEPLEATIKSGEGKTYRFKTKRLTREVYTLIIIGTKGIEFEERASIPVNQKSATFLIQTDKGFYQAGQTVKFRVFTLDSNLLPVVPTVNIIVYDGNGNRIEQYLSQQVQGVFSNEFKLANRTVVGEWRIVVEEEESAPTSLSFIVKEYTLPTFDVSVKTQPTYFTYDHSDVMVVVYAKFTYGQAVKGKARIRIIDEYCDLGFVHNCDSKVYKTKDVDIVGETVIPVNIVRDLGLPENVYRHEHRNFKIQATVLEDLTGIERNGTDILSIYPNAIKLEFLPSESFKPGLAFNQKLAVLYQDNTPIREPEGKVYVKMIYHYHGRDPTVKTIQYDIPVDGLVSINIDIPQKLLSLTLEATFRDIVNLTTISKAPVMGNHEYIQLAQISEKAIVSRPLKVEVTSTQTITNKLILLVIGKQDIIHVKTSLPSETTSQTLQFIITESMAPLMTVIVYYVTTCGYLVIDALTVQVEGTIRTPVSITVSPNRTEPGNEIELEVKTKEQAHVFLMAVDHRLHLHNLGNDLTEHKILDDLKGYELSNNYFYNPNINVHHTIKSFPWVTPHSPLQVFSECDLLIFQNIVEEYDSARPHHEYSDDATLSSDEVEDGQTDLSRSKTRTTFPETFIWIEGHADAKGRFAIKEKAPDVVSSFTFTAVALDKFTGLGVTQAKAELTIHKKFFAAFNVPYSVVKDEYITVRVLVYNYHDEKVTAKVTLSSQNRQFVFVSEGKETAEASKPVTADIQKRDGIAIDFKIVPKALGYIDLTVSAICFRGSDTLSKKLLVVAEGVTRHGRSTQIVDLRESTTFATTVPIEYPSNLVRESQIISFCVTGDILGLTLKNLDRLLYLPTGCGEQAMLLLAPGLAIARYLDSIGELKGELKTKLLSYMDQGVQTELTYKREDGSFSAFGNFDPVGSTWLTAFAVRVLYRVQKFVPVDKNVMAGALRFVKFAQQRGGSFVETGNVIHETMQKPTANGLVSLTAYACASLLLIENQQSIITVKDAIVFLEQQEPSQLSLYDNILVTYTLVLAQSSVSDKFLSWVETKATRNETEAFWSISSEVDGQQRNVKSLTIEATSYMVLIYKVKDRFDLALPIIRWLISRQHQLGGFESSQDTVLAIEALASFASRFSGKPDAKLIIDVSSQSKQFTVEKNNAFTLQHADLAATATSATISAFGNSFAVAQVSWSYNIVPTANESQQSSYELTTKVIIPKNFTKIFRIDVCATATRPKQGPSNMVVMEIWLPTGCVVDTNHLPHPNAANQIQKMQTKYGNTKIDVYFYSLQKTCISVIGIQNFVVSNSKQTPVRIFDYYNPDVFSEAFYSLLAAIVET